MSWIRSVALTRAADYMLASGIEPADLVRKLQLPLSALLDGDLWINRDRVFQLSTDLARIAGNACFGLHIREAGDFEMYGRWGEGIVRSSNLGNAIGYAAENIGLIETGRHLSLHTHAGGRVRCQAAYFGPVSGDSQQLDQATVLSLKCFADQTLEDIPVEVHLPFPQPSNTDEFERLLGPHLLFGAEHAAVVVDRDALSLPLRIPAPRAACDRKMKTPGDMVREVVCAMHAIILVERPSALVVASSLGVTLRTMQRNLRIWGTTFEELLTEFLMLRAAHELRSERCSVTDVAFILGYSDSGHFTRAFKRWAGCTPRDFRSKEDIDLPALQMCMLQEPLPNVLPTPSGSDDRLTAPSFTKS